MGDFEVRDFSQDFFEDGGGFFVFMESLGAIDDEDFDFFFGLKGGEGHEGGGDGENEMLFHDVEVHGLVLQMLADITRWLAENARSSRRMWLQTRIYGGVGNVLGSCRWTKSRSSRRSGAVSCTSG